MKGLIKAHLRAWRARKRLKFCAEDVGCARLRRYWVEYGNDAYEPLPPITIKWDVAPTTSVYQYYKAVQALMIEWVLQKQKEEKE